MKAAKRTQNWSFFFLLFLAAVGISAWQSWRWWSWAIAPANISASAKEITFQVKPGSTSKEIGRNLESTGVIRSAQAWNLWTRWRSLQDPKGGFQAGTYRLTSTDGMTTIANQIWTGDVVHSSYTIPEGWSIKQMASYFEREGFFPAQAFLDAAANFSVAKYPWLPMDRPAGAARLEGFLYPDTYQTPITPTPEAILKQMLDRFAQVALPIYQKGQNQTSLSFSEWVTLASIVEKEAVIPNERARIAGVFLNRLKKGMTLGADPTVEYGLGIQQTPDRPLTLAEVKTPSPYNTYLNSGLPPTAIASPGLASLKATLYPENTNYLYFVARYDGTHVFSRTLREHEAAQIAIHNQRDTSKSAKPQ